MVMFLILRVLLVLVADLIDCLSCSYYRGGNFSNFYESV